MSNGGSPVKAKSYLTIFLVFGLAIVVAAGCVPGEQAEEKKPDKKTADKKEKKRVKYDPKIDPKDFVNKIDNKYLTFTPGEVFEYEGQTDEGQEKIVVETLDETKTVMGVECVVVWDRVWLEGELIEDTKDWYAQDKEGNVWYFGEISKEYEDGKFIGTEGSWESGVDGAKPGIIMHAEPKIGPKYRQEYYQGEAEDMGQVLAFDQTAKTKFGEFDDCLKTKDWTPLEPGVSENKYYSPEVGGVVLEKVVGEDEKVELVRVTNR